MIRDFFLHISHPDSKVAYEGRTMLKPVIVIMAARATFHHQEGKQGVKRCACNQYFRQGKRRRPFAVFAGTYRYVLDPLFVDINVKIYCRKSSFSIPRVMDV